MIWKTALKTLRCNLGLNLLHMLQMAAVMLVSAVMVSAICIRYQTYLPFQDYFEGEGLFCKFSLPASDGDFYNLASRITSADELKTYISADSVLAAHEVFAYVDDGSENGEIPYALSYDEEIIKRYQLKLKSGRWFSENSTALELVISENDYGWNAGDVVSLSIAAEERNISVEATVVGVMENGAEVFGMFRSRDQSYGDIYKLAYYSFDFGIEGKPLLLFSYDALSKLEPMPVQSIYSSVLLSYAAGTDPETLKQDQQTLGKMDCAFSVDLTEMDQNSKQYLYQQLYQLLPIVAVLLVLVLVSSISSSALATRRRLRDYAMFYLCGMQWKQCAAVNFCQALLSGAGAILLTGLGMLVIRYTALSEKFLIFWNGYLAAVLAGMLLLYLLFSMLMPMMMLHAVTPNSILKSN